jgi:uncharacterized protein (DUF305 family)
MNTEAGKNPWPVILLVCVIVAGIIIVITLGFFYSPDGEWRTAIRMDPDRMFIEQMIPHHQDAIDMGNLALVRAEHPEIRQLAETIIRDQSREISLMRDWYKAWYGIDVPQYQGRAAGGRVWGTGAGMMTGGMGGSMTDLVQLGNATIFDKEFIEQMIPHHQMAIMMSGMVQNSEHKEMRELGSSIIRSQSAEVNQMRAWYFTWYGTEVPGFFPMGMNRGSGAGIP